MSQQKPVLDMENRSSTWMLLPMGVVFGDEMEKHVVDECFFRNNELQSFGDQPGGVISDRIIQWIPFRSAHIQSRTTYSFFKGSESMKFYTHHISSG